MSKKKNSNEDYYNCQADLTDFKAVSNQDCTGLIPARPRDDASAESYKQTYDYTVTLKENHFNKKQKNK